MLDTFLTPHPFLTIILPFILLISKWRWQVVKQVGNRPSMRTGLASAVAKDR